MENPSTGRADKLALQTRWLNHRMAGNPLWRRDMPSPRIVKLAEAKTFIAWRLDAAGQPDVLDVLRVSDIEASFTRGLSVLFTNSTSSSVVRITTYPREIVPGVFAWLPPYSEVRHCPHNPQDPASAWRLTLPMFVRDTVGSPATFSSLKEFRDRWPNVQL